MFKIGDWLRYIPGGINVEVTGVDSDFITVEDSNGESHIVVKEDFELYEVLE